MDLNNYFEEFTQALLHAYNEAELTRLVTFELKAKLAQIVGPGPLGDRVFELIEWCEREGRVDELFLAAIRKKPSNPKLRALGARIANDAESSQSGIAEKSLPLANKEYENPQADAMRTTFAQFQTNGALQAVVVAAPHLQTGQDFVGWAEGMNTASKLVCSIAGRKLGTGFLVGNDRIITNSHVVDAGAIDQYSVTFDFVRGQSRGELPKYTFKQELARSGPREFDFVILQLDRVPDGDRGYFRVKPYTFDKIREPVSVVGHPNGDPLSFAFGVVYDMNSFMRRVAYTANTAGGSSGSPVFAENWDLVAIHHHGETNINNHGVPMKSILKHLKSLGNDGLLTAS